MIIVAVTFGRIYAKRKQRRAIQQRNDLERQEQTRRGEAAGLPTYIDHGQTQAIPMPTLPYPERAYRPEAIQGDPNLPGYDPAPPKYDYGHIENASAPPATATVNAQGAENLQPEMQEAPRQPGQMHVIGSPSPAVSPAAADRRENDMETVPLGDPQAPSSTNDSTQRA